MIALDTNAIIHYLVKSQLDHKLVKVWFEKNTESLATTHTNIAEVLRLITHPKVFPNPMKLAAAVNLIKNFIEVFGVMVLAESQSWHEDLQPLAKLIPTLRGNDVFDARIALCLRHNGIKEIMTFDSDFLKYSFLKIISVA